MEGQKGDAVWNDYKEQIAKFDQISLREQLRWRIVKDMESLEEVLGQVLPFLDEIAHNHRKKTILLVTHANVMLSLLAHFSFVDSLNELPYGSIQNTAYIKVTKDKKSFRIAEVFGISKKLFNVATQAMSS